VAGIMAWAAEKDNPAMIRQMPLYLPQQASLAARLRQPHQALVVCFCADWCDTCRRYQADYAALAKASPDTIFVWADIEDHPDLLGEAEVENFPTLLVTIGGQARFYGPLLPHIGHLRRLLERGDETGHAVVTPLADDWVALLTGQI